MKLTCSVAFLSKERMTVANSARSISPPLSASTIEKVVRKLLSCVAKTKRRRKTEPEDKP